VTAAAAAFLVLLLVLWPFDAAVEERVFSFDFLNLCETKLNMNDNCIEANANKAV
jgi:hypothetical protein